MCRMLFGRFLPFEGKQSECVLLVFAILVALVSAEACSCRPCKRYSSYVQRCRCCTYHVVGGKRSLGFPSPLSPLSLTGVNPRDHDGVISTKNNAGNNDDIEDDDAVIDVDDDDVNLDGDGLKDDTDNDFGNVLKLYSKMHLFFQNHPELIAGYHHEKQPTQQTLPYVSRASNLYDLSGSNSLQTSLRDVFARTFEGTPTFSVFSNPKPAKYVRSIMSKPSMTTDDNRLDAPIPCFEDDTKCNLILLKLLQS